MGQLAPGTVLTLDSNQVLQFQGLQPTNLVLSSLPTTGTVVTGCHELVHPESAQYISLPLSVLGGGGVEQLTVLGRQEGSAVILGADLQQRGAHFLATEVHM